MSPKLLPIDMDYVAELLVRLLRTPSPSGRTDEVHHLIGSPGRAGRAQQPDQELGDVVHVDGQQLRAHGCRLNESGSWMEVPLTAGPDAGSPVPGSAHPR